MGCCAIKSKVEHMHILDQEFNGENNSLNSEYLNPAHNIINNSPDLHIYPLYQTRYLSKNDINILVKGYMNINMNNKAIKYDFCSIINEFIGYKCNNNYISFDPPRSRSSSPHDEKPNTINIKIWGDDTWNISTIDYKYISTNNKLDIDDQKYENWELDLINDLKNNYIHIIRCNHLKPTIYLQIGLNRIEINNIYIEKRFEYMTVYIIEHFFECNHIKMRYDGWGIGEYIFSKHPTLFADKFRKLLYISSPINDGNYGYLYFDYGYKNLYVDYYGYLIKMQLELCNSGNYCECYDLDVNSSAKGKILSQIVIQFDDGWYHKLITINNVSFNEVIWNQKGDGYLRLYKQLK